MTEKTCEDCGLKKLAMVRNKNTGFYKCPEGYTRCHLEVCAKFKPKISGLGERIGKALDKEIGGTGKNFRANLVSDIEKAVREYYRARMDNDAGVSDLLTVKGNATLCALLFGDDK